MLPPPAGFWGMPTDMLPSLLGHSPDVEKSRAEARQIMEGLGYAFIMGSGEALVHDSLQVRDKLSTYTKVVSRIQSAALVVNAALLAVVPMTYAIDPRAPFAIGTLAYTSFFITTFFMGDVIKHRQHKAKFKNLHVVLRARGAFLFALSFGMVGALFVSTSDMTNIAFKDLGINPAFLGWVFSAASIVGAFGGFFFHLVKHLRLGTYLFFDGVMMFVPFIAIYFEALPFLIVSTVLSIAFWRYRQIYYQERLLRKFPKVPKATLLSMLTNSQNIQSLWLPAAAGFVMARVGIVTGFGYLAVFGLFVTIIFLYSGGQFLGETEQP